MNRCSLLSEFRCVDYVFTFDEVCAGKSIELLRPDVFAVGAGSVGRYPDEIAAAEATGASIHQVVEQQAPSTSQIINTIKTQRDQPLVSIVYVNWNTKELLRDSLTTMTEHSRGIKLEIIVVDNGSEDGTVDWLRANRPDIKVVPLTENRGFAIGNNEGFREADGDYILLLNTDTLVLNTTVSGLVEVLEQYPKVGCVGARHLNGDRSLQRSMDSFPNIEADFLTLTELHRLGVVTRYLSHRHAWWGSHDHFRDVDWVNGACMMVRREVIAQTGGFDPKFFIYGEELEWCYRMHLAGWKVAFTPNAEVIHLGGAAMDHVSLLRLYLKYEGLMHFYDKHASIVSRFIIRAIILLTLAGRAGLLVTVGQIIPNNAKAQRFRELISQLAPETPLREVLGVWRRIMQATFRAHH